MGLDASRAPNEGRSRRRGQPSRGTSKVLGTEDLIYILKHAQHSPHITCQPFLAAAWPQRTKARVGELCHGANLTSSHATSWTVVSRIVHTVSAANHSRGGQHTRIECRGIPSYLPGVGGSKGWAWDSDSVSNSGHACTCSRLLARPVPERSLTR